jgi:hypothetical protein
MLVRNPSLSTTGSDDPAPEPLAADDAVHPAANAVTAASPAAMSARFISGLPCLSICIVDIYLD